MTNHFRKRAASDRSQEAMSLVPFFLSNSGKKKTLWGTMLGPGVGMEMLAAPRRGCSGMGLAASLHLDSPHGGGAALPISPLPSRARPSSSSSPIPAEVGRC